MELPKEYIHLYRHWPHHTSTKRAKRTSLEVFEDEKLFHNISAFIRERVSIWEKKYKGETPPYTSDRILLNYRFCNILRELDRQTIEFHTLLNPLRDNFPLWLLNMFYCRMVARTQTVKDVGFLSFDDAKNEVLFNKLSRYPRPCYGTPYVFPVSVIMKSPTPTREKFIARHLPRVMGAVSKEIEQFKGVSVVEGVERVLPLFGLNLRFLWTETLIDTAYQFPERLDLFKSFPVGPGALPTFRKIDPDIEPENLAQRLGEIQFDSGITFEGAPLVLSAENWEGVGCEYRKYTNLMAGKGRKRTFKQ